MGHTLHLLILLMSSLCQAWEMFQCKDNISSVDSSTLCDGELDCDEWESSCQNCTGIYCTHKGVSVCVTDSELCNGEDFCDDYRDEWPSQCNGCNESHLFQCHDGSRCITKTWVCDGTSNCSVF